MADDEGRWEPKRRPQSTLARSFSAALNEAFMMDNSLDGLSQSVEQKKKAVSTQSQELEALEARLKETEERLKQRQSMTFPSPTGINSRTGYHRRPPIDRTFSIENAENGQRTASSAWAMNSPAMESSSSETPAQPSYDAPPVPGALPETPSDNTASDYVVVDRDGETKGNRKYWVSTSDEPTPEKVAPQPTRKPPPQPTG